MVITLGGPPGSGTSTLAHLLKDELKLEYEYAGSIFRKTAKERKMTLENFGEYAKLHPEIDRDLDHKMLEFTQKENILVEGRMIGVLAAQENIKSFKIWLDASADTRVERISKRESWDKSEALRRMTSRDECDRKRYLELYKSDPALANCYDLVLSSDNKTPEELKDLVLKEINKS